jgi:dGTPase
MKLMDRYLIHDRFRQSYATTDDGRNPFENDFTRVIFSSSFRRLQDKTQVFQLDKGDFVRTRLTHSMEVSSLGRSIGLSLENQLINDEKLSEDNRGKIPSILAAAGLVHDLGNPPFGHFGESAIQSFFKDYFATHPEIVGQLTPQQRADLENFDGNVQTFRVLRKLHYIKDRDGMNMTHAVLATVIKYPFSSLEGNRKSDELSRKKFGFFESEKDDFNTIQETFDLVKRFPLTFLLEAADDIAYSVADIEDACKKGIIGADDIRAFLKDSLMEVMLSDEEREADFITLFDRLYDEVDHSYKNRLELAVQQFRIIAQRFMIKAVIKQFTDNLDAIIAGEYDKDLLEDSYASNIRKAFKLIGVKIFGHKSIIENEIIGFNVVTYLLKEFVPAVLSEGKGTNPKDKRYYDLISSNYRFIYENFTEKSIYNRLQLVADYISGMTDNFALKRYQKFKGILR